ncbi:MAG: ABC transporter [Piscirickettsiaceae bacterium]|nr:MAG: ABC transporter [Piscirickettsiaceae bacterium]
MKITRKTHQAIRLQNILFTTLFFIVMGMLAWLSTQYTIQSDWTKNSRNSLSYPSIQLLEKLSKPIEITAYVTKNDILRRRISELMAKYQYHKAGVTLSFVNPDIRPDLAREEGITSDGELVIRYNSRRESLKQIDEQSFTNALQRLASSEQRWVVFLTGHGERNIDGDANFDLSLFNTEIKRKGINTRAINLVDSPSIPQNTSLMIIADPKSALLLGEVNIIKQYLDDGGALLWLAEPNTSDNNKTVAELFAISFLPGIVVDATTQMFGIDDPTYALVTQYPSHPATQHLQTMSLFPGAAGLSHADDSPYQAEILLSTLERSWTETDSISGQIQFDKNSIEQQGPITIAYALTRHITNNDETTDKKQRLAIIGDSDFLSNSFLGNGANLDLGLSLIQWLNHDDKLIDIPAKTATDTTLNVTQTWTLVFGLGFLIILPVLFIAMGILIWLKRKKR